MGAAGVAPAPTGYQSEWHQFDNNTGETKSLGRTRGDAAMLAAPQALPTRPGEMIQIDLSIEGAPKSIRPVRLHFRRTAAGWFLVGLDRRAVTAPGTGTGPAERSGR